MANGDGADQTVNYSPGIVFTVRLRFMIGGAAIKASPTQPAASASHRPAEGEKFVSDVRNESLTFMTLYEQGHATPEQIDDFVEAWHESGDEEKRSLVEYLGMTEAEYDIEFITPRALPTILAARRAKRPLREFVEPFFEALQAAGDPADRSVLHALGFWLKRHPAC
jgi:hypothetical protein